MVAEVVHEIVGLLLGRRREPSRLGCRIGVWRATSLGEVLACRKWCREKTWTRRLTIRLFLGDDDNFVF